MMGSRYSLPGTNSVLIASCVPSLRIRLKRLEALIQTVLSALGQRHVLLSLVFVSDVQIRRLNKRFLKHDWVTDVLAFPFFHRARRSGKLLFLGEVIISPQRAKVESRRLQISFCEELVRYVCHGILHLLGFSDHSERSRNKMKREENRLLRLLGDHVERVI